MLESIATRPWYWAITTVIGVVAGLLGALYAEEIKRSVPFYWGPWNHFEWKAVLFWLSAIGFGAAFGSSQWAQTRITNRETAALKESVGLLQTLPPDNFLSIFEKRFADAYEATEAVLKTAARGVGPDEFTELIERTVRIVLDSLVALAKFFDGAPEDTIYAANVMVFRPLDGRTRDKLLFYDRNIQSGALQGALEVMERLSVTSQGTPGEPDASLMPFALPVPKPESGSYERSGRYFVQPGATWAFVFPNESAAFPDTMQLVDWLKNQGDFAPSIIDEVGKYFESEPGKQVRSFVSVAFPPPPSRPGVAYRPIGVLNIHRDRPGMLRSTGGKHFLPLTAPFRALLAQLVTRLEKGPEAQTFATRVNE